jgi:hypothetical protein
MERDGWLSYRNSHNVSFGFEILIVKKDLSNATSAGTLFAQQKIVVPTYICLQIQIFMYALPSENVHIYVGIYIYACIYLLLDFEKNC